MSLRRFFARLRAVRKCEVAERELDDEIRAHIEMEEAEQRSAGLSPSEARDQARRAFGNVTMAKEASRDAWIFRCVEELFQDVRYAVRQMRRNPGFTVVAILTLALGIGANTTIFSFFYSLALGPLPVKDPNAIVNVYQRAQIGNDYGTLSYPEYIYLRDQNTALSGLVAFNVAPMVLSSIGPQRTDDGEALQAMIVSGNYFSVLGETPAVGRTFLPEEDRTPGEAAVAVLSYAYWQRRFDGVPDIIGKTLTLNLLPYTVVGVAPKGFEGTTPAPVDLWVPMMMQGNVFPGADELHERSTFWLQSVGRLKPGTTRTQAQSEMTVLAQQFAQPGDGEKSGIGIAVTPGSFVNPQGFKQVVPVGLLLMLAVGIVLLIACANVANLALARGLNRQKEISTRLALGASRFRIVRQLLTESLLIALAGGSAGMMLAVWSLKAFLPFLHPPGGSGLHLNISFDAPTFAYAFLLSLLTGVGFGLILALRSSKHVPLATLKEEGMALNGRVNRARLRSILVVSQVAMSLFLLVAAGLLVRALAKAQTVDPGFSIKNVLVLNADVKMQNYDARRAASLDREMQERLMALPGVTNVGLGAVVPLGTNFSDTSFDPVDHPSAQSSPQTLVSMNTVSPRFFETLGIPVMRGRAFAPDDIAQNRKVAVISEALARHFWPGEDPIGKKFNKKYEVIGVAKDVRSVHLWTSDESCLYFPLGPDDPQEMTFFVRTAGEPRGLLRTVTETAQAIAPGVPVKVSRLEDNLAISIWPSEVGAILSATLGGLALLLALIGIYGVTSYSVRRRTHEIGIRVALGAQNSDVLRLVLGQSMFLVLIGVGIGLAISAAGARLLAGFLFGLSAFDVATFAGVATLFIAIAMLACYFPARRAMRVDPMTALHYE
jgi:macrolide transport system ATP-binding/permease protein